MWQQMLRKKYLRNKTIGQVYKKPGDSHFWSGLMKVNEQFLNYGGFHVNNGHDVRFWKNKWLRNFTLQHRFSSLYNLVQRKNATVASVFNTVPLNISFRRGLYEANLNRWHDLVALVENTSLNDAEDVLYWNLHQNKIFSVQSMYDAIVCNGHVTQDRLI